MGPRVHHVTVCIVIPPNQADLWQVVSNLRRRWNDPGYFRWPPHCNLLYPFEDVSLSDGTTGSSTLESNIEQGDSLNGRTTSRLEQVVQQLQEVTRRVEPFRVRLDSLGTFGGSHRGVLWLSPRTEERILDSEKMSGDENESSKIWPLMYLQERLEKSFSGEELRDQGPSRSSFTPHVTISHFPNITEALVAQQTTETEFGDVLSQLSFELDRIYLLRRECDDGQFLRLAEIGLGQTGETQIFSSPQPFPLMPNQEEEWVHTARIALKKRRNRKR